MSSDVVINMRLNDGVTAPASAAKSELQKLGSQAAATFVGFAGYQIAEKGITAINDAVKGAFSDAQAYANIQAQTAQVLLSTGSASGMTTAEIKGLGEELAKVTSYGSGTIQTAENLLLTFTSIGKDIMPATTEVVLDMSTALGEDLHNASIQVGKALQDPILGITALRRVGVSFTEDQKNVIKAMMESGDKAGAQAAILAELNREFGGSAKAAEAAAGGVNAAAHAAEDARRDMAMGLLPALHNVQLGFSNLQLYVFAHKELLAGLAAMILSIVVVALVAFVASLSAVVLIAGGVVLGIGAIVAAIVWMSQNWETTKRAIGAVWDFIKDAFSKGVDFLRDNAKTILMVVAGPVGLLVGYVVENWGTIWNVTKSVFSSIADGIGGVMDWILGLVNGALSAIGSGWQLSWHGMFEVISTVWNAITSVAKDGVMFVINMLDKVVSAMAQVAGGIGGKIADLGTALQIPGADKLGDFFDAVSNFSLKGAASQVADFASTVIDKSGDIASAAASATKNAFTWVKGKATDFFSGTLGGVGTKPDTSGLVDGSAAPGKGGAAQKVEDMLGGMMDALNSGALNRQVTESLGALGAKAAVAFDAAMADGTTASGKSLGDAISAVVDDIKTKDIPGWQDLGAALAAAAVEAVKTGTGAPLAAALQNIQDAVKAAGALTGASWASAVTTAMNNASLGSAGVSIMAALNTAITTGGKANIDTLAGLAVTMKTTLADKLPPAIAADLGTKLMAALADAAKTGGAGAIAVVQGVIQQISDALSYADLLKIMTDNNKQIVADNKAILDAQISSAESQANLLGDQVMAALKARYADVRDQALASIQAQKDALADQTQAAIDGYNAQKDAAIAGIDAQIAAIDGQQSATQRVDLVRALAMAYDPEARAKAEAALTTFDQNATKAQLNQQKTDMGNYYAGLVKSAQDSATAQTKVLDGQVKAANALYATQTADWKIQQEAMALITDQTQSGILADLMNKYAPGWKTAGISFGQQMVEGLTNSGVVSFVANLMSQITTLQTKAGGGAATTPKPFFASGVTQNPDGTYSLGGSRVYADGTPYPTQPSTLPNKIGGIGVASDQAKQSINLTVYIGNEPVDARVQVALDNHMGAGSLAYTGGS